MALLEVRGLTVNYGPIQAVRGIDLDVEEGQIVALLGANGAGKTTTLRAISGVLRPSGGAITLNGTAIGRRASKVARQGVRMSPEGRLIFYGLTVEENLRVGAIPSRTRAVCIRTCGGYTSCSQCWSSATGSRRPLCPAANSRCWPLAGP